MIAKLNRKFFSNLKNTFLKSQDDLNLIKNCTNSNFPNILKRYSQEFEKRNYIDKILPKTLEKESDLKKLTNNLIIQKNDLISINKGLLSPIVNLLERGGKRIRPVMCILLAECFEGNVEEAAKIGAICEIIHNGTLIIDDIEDDSQFRRNLPCVHKIFGIDNSVNCGVFVLFEPLKYFIDSCSFNNETKLKLLSYSITELINLHIGQAWDIAWHQKDYDILNKMPSEEQYLQMCSFKTGVLPRLGSKLVTGFLGLDESLSNSISKFCENIGIAFQIQDDILNLTSEELEKGKGYLGEDIHEGKLSLIVIHTLQNAKIEDKNRLVEILKLKTSDKKIIQNALYIIDKYKGIDYSRKLSEKIVEKSWKELESLLPDNNSKKLLELLANYCISRNI